MDPVIEQYRVNLRGNSYSGVFTLAYPSKNRCIVLGFISSSRLKKSQLMQLKKHVLSRGRKLLVFYRQKQGKEFEKIYTLN
jgi:hypothetical protein